MGKGRATSGHTWTLFKISDKPGFEFCADSLGVNVPSVNGSNYILVVRCTACGFFMPPIFLELKST